MILTRVIIEDEDGDNRTVDSWLCDDCLSLDKWNDIEGLIGIDTKSSIKFDEPCDYCGRIEEDDEPFYDEEDYEN